MREVDRTRPVGDVVEDLRDVDLDEVAHALPREHARAVLEVRRQDLVAGFQVERPSRHVHAGGGVLDEGQVVAPRADEGAELAPRLREQGAEAAHDEVDRLTLELPLPGLVALEDRPRRRPEGPVVEEGHLGVQEEQVSHGANRMPSGAPRTVTTRCTRAPGHCVRARTRCRPGSPPLSG